MPLIAEVQQGSTTAAAKKVRVCIIRSDTAAPYTGISEGTAAANFKYSREGVGSFTAIDFTVSGIDLTEIGEGYYDIVAPDAAFVTATGVGQVVIAWSGVANMLADSVIVLLRPYDPKATPDTKDTISLQVMADLADSDGAGARTAIANAAATAVDAIIADNFAAIPGAVVAAMRTEVTLSAWGVTSQPGGGSTLTYVERRNGSSIGTRTAYFNSANICVGMTAVV